jgi:hypothetical protein
MTEDGSLANEALLLRRGEPYPLPVALEFGAAAQFLMDSGSILQICIPDMTPADEECLRSGCVTAGLLVEGSALLLVFQFHAPDGRPVLLFDCPYDARLVAPEARRLPSTPSATESHLLIQVHAVDGQGLLRALRGITLSPELTRRFLSAVMDQLSALASGKATHGRWRTVPAGELARQAGMRVCGE